MSLRSNFTILLFMLNGLILIFSLTFYLNVNTNRRIRTEISYIDDVNKDLLEEGLAARGLLILPLADQIEVLDVAEKKLDKAVSDLLQINFLSARSDKIDQSIKNIIGARYEALAYYMPEMWDTADKMLSSLSGRIDRSSTLEEINNYARSINDRELLGRVTLFKTLLFEIEDNIMTSLSGFDEQYRIIDIERARIERGGVILFIAFFLTMAFISVTVGSFIIRSIMKMTYELDQANKETDAVFKNIHEGIFQLDENLIIGSLCSKYFEDLFGHIEFRGLKFTEFLDALGLPARDVLTTDDYLKLFFNSEVNNSLLIQVNPLDKIGMFLPDSNGATEEKYLSFTFSLFKNADGKSEILGTVKDRTEEILYMEALKDEEEKNKEKMEQLFQVIHVDPSVMNEFFEDSQNEVNHINSLLKANKSNFHSIIQEIYLSVHSIKGNAQILGMKNFASMLHKIETDIKALLEKPEIKWESTLEFALHLGDIQEGIDDLKERVNDIMQFQSRVKGLTENTGLFERTLQRVAAQEGRKYGKLISLDYSNFNSKNIPEGQRKLVKDIFVQLTRNSIIHGIEMPKDRLKKKKTEEGTISITSYTDDSGNIVYSFKDDGNGIDVQKIEEKVRKNESISDDSAIDLTDAIKYIFTTGFSTAEQTDISAGRGVGLPFIKARVTAAGGKLKVKTQKGNYCEFIITLPANAVIKNI